MNNPEGKEKVFRDSVHGYISVPESYGTHFIDTPCFQRLRHIEQTSMRCLYPSARHDRFVHSLGVYHLGRLIFDNLQNNAFNSLEFKAEKWTAWRHTFLIACLMHDCAHAPFSHTFEKYYALAPKKSKNQESVPEKKGIEKLLAEKAAIDESELSCLPTGSEHEKISAILLLDKYRDAFKHTHPGADPVLAARMITGWSHLLKDTPEKQFENILISLLNGPIDVDKLDYIIRDTWASGADNASVDIHRLLKAVCVGRDASDRLVTTFGKSALSVIDGVFAARNHLYRWIYSHHKVLYAEDLLKRAVASLGGIAKEEQDEFLCSLFSLAPFSTLQKVADREFFLPSDGDLIYHLKIVAASDSESYAYEWLSRRYKKVALWKSFAEFCRLFAVSAKYSTTDKATCLNKFQSLAENWKKAQKITDCDIRVLDVSPKLITLDSAKIRIQMGKETVPYTDLLLHTGQDNTSVPEFFYAYIDQHYENRAEELLKYVKSNW